MTAEAVAHALGGRRAGDGWMACCPVHGDRTASLSIPDGSHGRLLVKCHAGCAQRDVIDVLRARGLWPSRAKSRGQSRPPVSSCAVRQRSHGSATVERRTTAAMAIWQAAEPASGTAVEAYLRSRGLDLSPPTTLRFHHGLRHPAGARVPAMVALVSRGVDDAPVAIHRTFLAIDGTGKAAVVPSKMMLGPCRGGVVRLADANDLVMIGEGIETCLTVMHVTGHPAWAALSAAGLRAIDLPPTIREVVILADGDPPGEVAALKASRRLLSQGRRVWIARPPTGLDFNDLLLDEPRPAEANA